MIDVVEGRHRKITISGRSARCHAWPDQGARPRHFSSPWPLFCTPVTLVHLLDCVPRGGLASFELVMLLPDFPRFTGGRSGRSGTFCGRRTIPCVLATHGQPSSGAGYRCPLCGGLKPQTIDVRIPGRYVQTAIPCHMSHVYQHVGIMGFDRTPAPECGAANASLAIASCSGYRVRQSLPFQDMPPAPSPLH